MKLLDTNRYYLPGQNVYLHLATITENLREWVCFADTRTNQVFIEELTFGQLDRIEDDSLAQALSDFLTYKGVLLMDKPLIPDEAWYNKKPPRED